MASSDYDKIINDAAEEWDIDPRILRSVMMQESGGHLRAVSSAGAKGLMQIMPATGQELGLTNPYDPQQSIFAGAKYLSQLFDKYGKTSLALAAYNAGPQRVDDYLAGRGSLPRETLAYVPSVAKIYASLEPPKSTETATQPQAPVSANTPLILGDSIGQGIQAATKAQGYTKVGANPQQILSTITGLPDDQVRGRNVVLSGGASNNPDQVNLVEDQIKALKAKGAANVTVVGVGDRPDFKAANLDDKLAGITYQNGGTFVALDPATLGKDRVHPTNYTNLAGNVFPQQQQVPSQPALPPNDKGNATMASSRPSDEDLEAQWGVGKDAAKPSAASSRLVDTDLEKLWGVAPAQDPAAKVADKPVSPPAGPDYTGWDQVTPEAKLAQTYAVTAPSSDTSYQTLQKAIEPAPNTTYGQFLPIARDNTTGALRPAMPQAMRDLAQGGLDLAMGPTSGTVTPEGTMALATLPLTSPASGSGAVTGLVNSTGRNNPLRTNPILSDEFKAAPGILEPSAQGAGTSTLTRRPVNPLASGAEAATETASPSAPLLPPLTSGAAVKRADALIQSFSAKPAGSTQEMNLIPGYKPTLAEVTGDTGLANLQRSMKDQGAHQFDLQKAENNKVIADFTNRLVGDASDVDAATTARQTTVQPMYDKVFANKTATSAQPVSDMIDKLLAGPEGKKQAVASELQAIQRSLHVGNDLGAPLETDPLMLKGVKENLDHLLSPLAQSDKPGLQQAARSLMGVKQATIDAIEAGAPGYKAANQRYAELSQPIEESKYLQSLNLTNASGDVALQKIDTAIKTIQRQQQMNGVRKADNVSGDSLTQLQQLRDTLRAQGFGESGGKAIGSNTFQNAVTGSKVQNFLQNPMVQAVANPLAVGSSYLYNPALGVAVGLGSHLLNRSLHKAGQRVSEEMVNRLLNGSAKVGENTLRSGG